MSHSSKFISPTSELLQEALLSPRNYHCSCSLRRVGFEEKWPETWPNCFNSQCVQELNESTPAAHVLSVCAYFPNLDMGSELQALRVYVKSAWLSPFHSPDLAVAQHRDAPCRWDYWLQRASCLKSACMGLAGPRGALAHLSCHHTVSCPCGEQ